MYLLYLDESGDPNSWQNQKNYVLGGVAIHEGQVYRMNMLIENIQNKYFPGVSIPITFHCTDIRGGRGHFRGLTPNIREQILNDIYSIIAGAAFPNLIAFATALDISAVQSPTQVRRDTLEDVVTRFNTFLMRQFKAKRPSKGLLIIDENRAVQYRELVDDFKRQGVAHGYLGNVVDIPYFAKSRETRMLQLADFISNAVFRYYERGEHKYLDIIMPRFDRREKLHPPDGFKHITNSTCSCRACSWRT